MKKLPKILVIAVTLGGLVLLITTSAFAPTLIVYLDKPKDIVNKTDNLKVQGDIFGLEEGKTYIIRIQVFEDGTPHHSEPLLKSFYVE